MNPPAAPIPSPDPASAPPPYELSGIPDPGMNGLIAYAVKIPRGWQMRQSLTRQWNGAIPNVCLYLGMASPDGRDQIEFLPPISYHFSNSQATQWTQQMMAQQGQRDPSFLAPLLPLDYLKRVFLPQMVQQAHVQLQITAENATPPTPMGGPPVPGGPIAESATGYVECALPTGRKIRVNTALIVYTGNVLGSLLQTWMAVNRVVQSEHDLPACLAHADFVEKSFVTNPAWQAQDQQLQQRGMQMNQQQSQANLQATIRQGQANLDASRHRYEINREMQEYRREAINHNFQTHQHATDQAHHAFVDYIADRTLYENPNTGERVKVQGHFDHVYQNTNVGTDFLGTNAPLDPSSVNWQELQQVPLRNY